MNASPFVILDQRIVILNLFQDLLRRSAKPDEVLKQVQDDETLIGANS